MRGFTLPITGNTHREFIFINDTMPPVHGNLDPVKSVAIKKMVHALTTPGDFEADSIFSAPGETFDFTFCNGGFDGKLRGPWNHPGWGST